MSFVIVHENKLQCDNCGRIENVEQALKDRWTYSQSGHMCNKCVSEELVNS